MVLGVGLALLLIGLIYALANFLVKRDLDRYVKAKQRYQLQKQMERTILESNQNAQMRFMGLKSYEPFLIQMDHGYTLQELREILERFFYVNSIEQVEVSSDGRIRTVRYVVWVKMEHPRSFFDFLHTIKERAYPIKIAPPLEMRKVDDMIEATFALDLYALQ
jgi:hypothetical protein